MHGLTRASQTVVERRHDQGLLDTSVVIDLENLDPQSLPTELAISSVTLAELAAGPHATDDVEERARRQDRLQRAEATFDPLAFDDEAARAYGRVYATVVGAGRKARGARVVDLFIAAIALANDLPLYTNNTDDFAHLDGLIEVVVLRRLAGA